MADERHGKTGHAVGRNNPDEDESNPVREDDFEKQVAESGGLAQIDKATAMSLEELRTVTEKLRKDRQVHIAAVQAIDHSLNEFRQQLDQLLEETQEPEQPRRQGRQRQARSERGGRGGPRGSRSGSGTSIIEGILRKHNGEMNSGDLASQAKEQGVKFPHSSFQSLKKRGLIELENHMVRLVEKD